MENKKVPSVIVAMDLEARPEFNVVLLGGESGHAGNATGAPATLRELAEGANLRFLCKEMDWPVMGSDLAVTSMKPHFRKELRRDTPLASLCERQPRWGFNDY